MYWHSGILAHLLKLASINWAPRPLGHLIGHLFFEHINLGMR